MFQACFECGHRGQVLQSHSLPISPLLQTPDFCVLSLYRSIREGSPSLHNRVLLTPHNYGGDKAHKKKSRYVSKIRGGSGKPNRRTWGSRTFREGVRNLFRNPFLRVLHSIHKQKVPEPVPDSFPGSSQTSLSSVWFAGATPDKKTVQRTTTNQWDTVEACLSRRMFQRHPAGVPRISLELVCLFLFFSSPSTSPSSLAIPHHPGSQAQLGHRNRNVPVSHELWRENDLI